MNIFPKNIASYGESIDSLALLITVVVGIGFVLAAGIFFYSLFRFRNRPDLKASYVLGETWSQLRWVMIPTIVLFGLDLFIDAKTHSAWQEIKEYVPADGQRVLITAQQYSWVFTYPNAEGMFGGQGSVVSNGELHVPVGKNVIFLLEAKDVLHSFWVPSLRLKQDAVPGRLIKGWFQATETGTYDIGCAQICGIGHTSMHANLVVETQETFDKWLAAGGPSTISAPTGGTAAERGAALAKAKGCVACHSTDGSRLVGPSYKGLFGRNEKVVTNGATREVLVDESYLRKSMLEPAADVVEGFPPVMPPQRTLLTDEEIDLLIEYIKTLK